MEVSVTVKSDELTLAVAGQQGTLSLFTPANAASPIRYELVVAREELASVLPAEQISQWTDDYCVLAELGTGKPGEFLDSSFTLSPLPNGRPLPAGEYNVWIIRYEQDEADLQWKNTQSSTLVRLSVSP